MRLQVKWINGWAYAHGTGPDGRRIRRALKTKDHRRAEEARANLEARLWKLGLYGTEAVVTFAEAAVAYAEDGGDVRFLPKLVEIIGAYRLREITPKIIRDAARKAYPDAAPATRNRQGIVPAQAVVNFGHREGWCAPVRVERFKEEKPRRQAVGRDYIDALRPHVPLRLFALMLYLHQTGRRVSDALSLEPTDREGCKVYVHETKNGEPVHAYLTEELAELLDQVEPRHGRLFGYVHRGSVYKTLRRATEKAGLPYLGTHQPGRHSFATTLDAAGWKPKEIADAGGWKTTRMVSETYTHPKDAALRASELFGKNLAKPNADKAGNTNKTRLK